MNSAPLRTFICFAIPPAIRAYMAELQAAGREFGEPVSWTKAESLHVTLKFLGATTRAQAAEVQPILREVSARFRPVSFTLNRIGVFPAWRNPRVLWLGQEQEHETLLAIVAALEEGLQKIGFAREKRGYRTHVTLGRVKRQPVTKTMDFFRNLTVQPQTFIANHIIFMQSELKPGGAKYTPLGTFPLKKES